MIGKITIALASLIGGCVEECAPQRQPAPVQNCDERISWDGRSPVRVVREKNNVQAVLDRGNAVNMGYSGHDFVAGHYSTHGAIFRAGNNLSNGDVINYDCRNYVVTGRATSYYGAYQTFRAGLTVIYSGCGNGRVCLVFAR